jgi:hypothetical protein
MTEQEKTINKIEKTMRTWIENQLPVYEQMPAAQTMTTTQGERVLKANPATAEIRAAFKDYCYVVRTQKELSDGSAVDTTAIDDLRKKFKVV